MDIVHIGSDPLGLGVTLPWLIGALVAYYLARTIAALLLLALSRRRPSLRRAALSCAPATLRPVLRRAAAGGLLAAALTGTAAMATPGADEVRPCSAQVPLLDRAPGCTPSAAAAHGAPDAAPPPTASSYEVRAGDSLWRITERLLGPEADRERVAAAWPSLWEANRAQVGADPDLIRPGTILQVPVELAVVVAR